MVILRGCSESKRRLRASGVVRSLPSSMTSPLSVSIRHIWGCICHRDPARLSSLVAPCYHYSRADSSFHSEPIGSSYILQTLTQGTALGGRPSHLIFGENPFHDVG
jgi:hypothetical protein